MVDELSTDFVSLCDNWSANTLQILEGMHRPDTLCHGMTDVAYFTSQSVYDEVAATRGDDLDLDEAMDRYRAGLVFYISIATTLLTFDTRIETAR